MKILVKNKKAFFDYAIRENLNAGMVLSGSEVKSLRAGQGSLVGAYVTLRDMEAWLTHAHITPYKYAAGKEINPDRDRKLLLNKKELSSLVGKEKGSVIIPLEIIESDRGLIKLRIGLGFGKNKYDKREAIKKRETSRKIREEI